MRKNAMLSLAERGPWALSSQQCDMTGPARGDSKVTVNTFRDSVPGTMKHKEIPNTVD